MNLLNDRVVIFLRFVNSARKSLGCTGECRETFAVLYQAKRLQGDTVHVELLIGIEEK